MSYQPLDYNDWLLLLIREFFQKYLEKNRILKEEIKEFFQHKGTLKCVSQILFLAYEYEQELYYIDFILIG